MLVQSPAEDAPVVVLIWCCRPNCRVVCYRPVWRVRQWLQN